MLVLLFRMSVRKYDQKGFSLPRGAFMTPSKNKIFSPYEFHKLIFQLFPLPSGRLF
jgi:hypothetical protein